MISTEMLKNFVLVQCKENGGMAQQTVSLVFTTIMSGGGRVGISVREF